ncbi:hypothetical protein ACFWA1_38600 [Streptomyces sp. NPDC060005]
MENISIVLVLLLVLAVRQGPAVVGTPFKACLSAVEKGQLPRSE